MYSRFMMHGQKNIKLRNVMFLWGVGITPSSGSECEKAVLGIAVCDVLSFSDCVIDVTQYSLVHRHQCFLGMYHISFPP